MRTVDEMIKKWNQKLGYRNGVEGVTFDRNITADDLAWCKEHKAEIMAELKVRKRAEELETKKRTDAEFEAKYPEQVAESKRTGKPVKYWRGTEECNDPYEECNIDIVTCFVKWTENGLEFSEKRQHTW